MRTNSTTVKLPRLDPPRREATSYVFKLAALSTRVKRVYFYHWAPAPTPNPTWDSALVDARPSPPRLRGALRMAAQARHRALTALLALAARARGLRHEQGRGDLRRRQGHRPDRHGLLADHRPGRRQPRFRRRARSSRSPTRAAARACCRSTSPRSTSAAPTRRPQATAARRAITDPQIIAAIVDATNVTVPLFNAAGHPPGRDRAATRASPATRRRCRRASARSATPPTAPTPAGFRRALQGAVRPRTRRPPPPDGYRAMQGVLKAIATRARPETTAPASSTPTSTNRPLEASSRA